MVSTYLLFMTDNYVAYDDLPVADEHVIRAHAAELMAMAEALGLANVRCASTDRIVVTVTDRVEYLEEFRFAERANFMMGHQIRVYTDGVFKKPGGSLEVVAARPL